jgi:hypothetical protein
VVIDWIPIAFERLLCTSFLPPLVVGGSDDTDEEGRALHCGEKSVVNTDVAFGGWRRTRGLVDGDRCDVMGSGAGWGTEQRIVLGSPVKRFWHYY